MPVAIVEILIYRPCKQNLFTKVFKLFLSFNEIPFGLIKKIKVKKMLLLPSYKINIEGRMLDGKKYRYKMVINKKVGGGHFPDQEENSLSLINILSSLS